MGWTTMSGLWEDVQFAARALARRPGFTVVAVLTMIVGIGANTTIFSVVDGVLFRPLPYPDSDRMGILWHEFGDGAQDLPAVHALDVRDYRAWSELFETFTMATGRELILGGAEAPEVVDVGLVEAGFFDFFGVEPIRGRTFTQGEDVPGASSVALLSHRLWERRFGADPDVVGRTVPLGGGSAEVVGVLPASFRLALPAEAFRLRDAEIWVALRLDPARQPPRNYTGYTGFGLLKPGVGFERAQAEIDGLEARLKEEHPEHAASNLQARIVPLHRDVVKNAEGTLFFLFGAVGFVLLIACANVANLLLVRGQGRTGELAVRAAMGAGRGRLVRLVLLESAMLAGAGALGGVLLAAGGLELVTELAPGSVPRFESVSLDGRVLLFAAGLGGLTAILLGALPALRVSGVNPARFLTAEVRVTGTRDSHRLRSLLIVGQIAGSLVLLVGTGLMVRSFAALGEVDPGFQDEDALSFRVNVPRDAFDDWGSLAILRRTLEEELGALPGVASVAAVSQLPLTGSGPLQPYAFDEETAANWESVTADHRVVSPRFFEAMGARLLAGETFTGDPDRDRGTIVIDDRLARRAFPGIASRADAANGAAGAGPEEFWDEAIGQRLQVAPNGTPEEERYARVVGVVEHLRLHDLAAPYLTQIWAPMDATIDFSVVLRAAGVDAASLAEPARAVVATHIPGAPVEDVRRLEDLTSAALAPVRLSLALMSIFGVVALLLASVGIYGVLAYAVSRRTREIGLRMALGQSPAEVQRDVLAQGLGLLAVALVVGLGAAALLARAAQGLFFGVAPADPLTYAATTTVLAVVSLLACWIPARRATRVDPREALRAS